MNLEPGRNSHGRPDIPKQHQEHIRRGDTFVGKKLHAIVIRINISTVIPLQPGSF